MLLKELYDKVNDGKIISDIELQREIIYSPEKQLLVIDSIVKGIPLPAFYFWKNENSILEVLDGKQRIEAIRKFYQNNLEYEGKLWKQWDSEFQQKINETKISDIACSGTEELKREIFYRINTLGVPLSRFEVLNGLYNGEYLRGLTTYVKQDKDILKALSPNNRGNNQMWVLKMLGFLQNAKDINEYVKVRKAQSFEDDMRLIGKYIKFINSVFDNTKELDIYFRLAVKYEKDIVIWKEHKASINKSVTDYLKDKTRVALTDKAKEIEDIIQAIVQGISVDPKRLFTSDDKLALLRQQTPENNKYKCAGCGQFFFDNELEVDHITAWSKGGRTELSNAQLLCRACNGKKGNG
jgi:5-methylcytosine-specific restriction endonuclease McrA